MTEYIRESKPYRLKKQRPFKLVIKSGPCVYKIFLDDKEPMEEYIMAHHMSGCTKCFEIRCAALDSLSGQTEEEE